MTAKPGSGAAMIVTVEVGDAAQVVGGSSQVCRSKALLLTELTASLEESEASWLLATYHATDTAPLILSCRRVDGVVRSVGELGN